MLISLTPTVKEKEWLKNAYVNVISTSNYTVPTGYKFLLLKLILAQQLTSDDGSGTIQPIAELKRDSTLLAKFRFGTGSTTMSSGDVATLYYNGTMSIVFLKPILFETGEVVTVSTSGEGAGKSMEFSIMGYKFPIGDYY